MEPNVSAQSSKPKKESQQNDMQMHLPGVTMLLRLLRRFTLCSRILRVPHDARNCRHGSNQRN